MLDDKKSLYVECIRKGIHKPFRLKKEICIAAQSNPALNKRCKRCKQKEANK